MRRQKRTVLFFGEGLVAEKEFLSQVKVLCLKNHQNYSMEYLAITVSSDNGGSPRQVIKEAKKEIDTAHYDRCILLMDTDVAWPDYLPSKYGKTDMLYLGCSPCLEGFLLKLQGILIPPTSRDCKTEFYGTPTPRGIEARRRINDVLTWELIQTAYSENCRIAKCLLDHYDLSKHQSYPPGYSYRD